MNLLGTILLNVIVTSFQDDTVNIRQSSRMVETAGGVNVLAIYTCELISAAQPPPPPTFFTSFSIERTTHESRIELGEVSVSIKEPPETLCLLEPSSGELKLSELFPPSKPWTAKYEIKTLKWSIISLILTLREVQCNDSGLFLCVAKVADKTELLKAKGHVMTTSAPTTIDLSFATHTETGKHSVTTEAGANVTLTCNVTGPPNLNMFWKFANLSSAKEAYLEGPLFQHGNKWISVTGCVTMSYTSEIHKKVQADDNGTTYFCCVTNIYDKEITREQLTIWIKDSPSHNNDKIDNSHNSDKNPNSDDSDKSSNSDDSDKSPNSDDSDISPNSDDSDKSPNGDYSDKSPDSDYSDKGPKSDDSDKSPKRDDSDTNGKVSSTYRKQYLAILLTISIFLTKLFLGSIVVNRGRTFVFPVLWLKSRRFAG
ncbi:GATA zinc finger domain-containing protein 15 [Biomphalaria pfeifferi]|uniref:GATA zinc finger domain-containing protein 15 n=1 Tax=Biomphalaria pfeifferi TaxID=112525 RepID=A0AAD8FIM4_BIOPF|nr:GATA zinc finger domain-containing protein 15 [Biomphalaria pfeifferi]